VQKNKSWLGILIVAVAERNCPVAPPKVVAEGPVMAVVRLSVGAWPVVALHDRQRGLIALLVSV
jgi:hypothetical protein